MRRYVTLLALTGVAAAASLAAAKPGVHAPAAPSVALPAASAKPALAAAAPSSKPAASAAPKPPSATPAPKPPAAAAAPPAKPKPAPTKPTLGGSPTAQKAVAGGPTANETANGNGAESPELKVLREAEVDMFAGAAPAPGHAWPSDLPSSPKGPAAASGLPSPAPGPEAVSSAGAATGKSLGWLANLKMPDLPVRWDARVVKYLEFFKDDPRGRRIFTVWWKRAGRYRELVQEQLRGRGLPEDLVWVAMAESGFDPTIKSPAGATGLWQFMPEAAKAYGLSVDRWADMRHSPLRSTEAAASFLGDLKKRFGTWELALAAYNMGYGGVLSVVKKFNSNDYWELSKYENALPWETTHYVPKIVAMAVVAKNPQVFGYDTVVQETSLKGDVVDVPAGTELKAVAALAGCTVKELETLNPELRAGRTPPALDPKAGADEALYTMLVPTGRGAALKDAGPKLAPKGNALEKYVVRFGETLDQIATVRKTTKAKLVELNGIGKDEAVRGGTTLLVPTLPAGTVVASSPYASPGAGGDHKPTVLVPPATFAYPDRKRVFYRVIVGDTPKEIAVAFAVTVDELRSWNAIEPTARLQEGMTLQLFVAKGADLSRVVAMKEAEVKLLTVGSDEFYAQEEALKGRKRVTVYATAGETLEAVGKKHGLTAASMEKINRRPRTDVLKAGEAVIVYVATGKDVPGSKPPATPATATTTVASAKPVAASPSGEGDLPAVPSSLPSSSVPGSTVSEDEAKATAASKDAVPLEKKPD